MTLYFRNLLYKGNCEKPIKCKRLYLSLLSRHSKCRKTQKYILFHLLKFLYVTNLMLYASLPRLDFQSYD